MMSTTEETAGETRERIEHEADAARERLLGGLDRLNERRNRLGQVVGALQREAQQRPLLLLSVGVSGLGVLGLLLMRRRARARREEHRAIVLQLVRRALPVLAARVGRARA